MTIEDYVRNPLVEISVMEGKEEGCLKDQTKSARLSSDPYKGTNSKSWCIQSAAILQTVLSTRLR